MAVNLSFIGGAGWQFLDNNGKPLSGGKIFTYDAGTTTPQTTFTSRTGLVPNTNPIILDSAGRTPEQIWATEGVLYKYVVKTANDVEIRTWDNIGGSVVASDLAQDLAASSGSSMVGFLQAGVGAVPTTVQAKLRETVSVKDFGAVGDGVTDDTAAIQAALTESVNKKLVFPKVASGYLTTDTVTASGSIDIEMQSPVLYAGTQDKSAIKVVNPTRATLELQAVSVTQSNWTDADYVGIEIVTARECSIAIRRSEGFTVGVLSIGDGTFGGTAYNNFFLYRIVNNQTGIRVTCKNTGGFNNENVYIGGEFRVFSGVNTSLNRWGVVITSEDLIYVNNNGHVFLKPSFELNISSATEDDSAPLWVEYGNMNSVYGARQESSGKYTLISDSFENRFDASYTDKRTLQYFYNTLKGRGVVTAAGKPLALPKPIFTSQALHKQTIAHDTGTQIFDTFPGFFSRRNNGDLQEGVGGSGVVTSSHVELPSTRTLSFMVDTTVVKVFAIATDTNANRNGRLVCRPYDSSGALLDGTSTQYVTGSGNWTTTFGGAFRSASDRSTTVAFISVTNDVKSLEIGIVGGTNDCEIRSLSLHTLNEQPVSVWANPPDATFNYASFGNYPIARGVPNSGPLLRGQIAFHAQPSAATAAGWMVTVSGTGGVDAVVKAMANLET
jgi:hypothetical protein